jgi:phenylalanyl-tRNA synthetase alpha chain
MLHLFGGRVGATASNPLKVRWIEATFPWTTPSFEVEVFFRGKWLEILGCGVVRQATLDNASTLIFYLFIR